MVIQDKTPVFLIAGLKMQDLCVCRIYNWLTGLPGSLTSKTNVLQGIRLYVMATNLVTITNYTGIDPENDYNPPAKQFIVGLNASF